MMAAAVSPTTSTALFELKSAALTLVSVVVKTADIAALRDDMTQRLGETPELFDNDPVVLDVSALRDQSTRLDFIRLVGLLREHRMQPLAVKGATAEQAKAALEVGLYEAPEGVQPTVREASAPTAPPELPKEDTPPPAATAARTVLIDKPLRSGQQVYARGGDLIITAAVNHGAEVIADGHIHVYAPLRGRAIAGARGNMSARIFTTNMEPQLISVAGIYKTSESALPANVQGKPATVRLDGERLVIEPLIL